MTLAYDYPLFSIMISMMWFFLLFVWIMAVFHVIVDIFRSDVGGVAKAMWFLFVLFLPVLGVLMYLVTQGDKMTQRAIDDAQKRDAQFQSYVRDAAGTTGAADEIAKLAALRDSGALTDEEFQAGKAKLLA